MPMQRRKLGPIEQRPTPKPGFPEAVIPKSAMRVKTVDGAEVLTPRVPSFTVTAPHAMYWNGLCLEAGTNHVDVARFNSLPTRTKLAVQQHVREGQFGLSGYADACKALEEAASKAAKVAAKKPAEVDAGVQAARNKAADELGELKVRPAQSRRKKKTQDENDAAADELGNLTGGPD